MKATAILPCLLAICLITSSGSAQETPKAFYLKGLRAVNLKITISKDVVNAGFQGARLRTMAELQLRKAGLQVDRSQEAASMVIDITGVRGPGTNNYAIAISTSVNEDVRLMRNEDAIHTTVWGTDMYILYLPNQVPETVMETAQARIDVFLNDWLQANPRIPEPTVQQQSPVQQTVEAPPAPKSGWQILAELLQASAR